MPYLSGLLSGILLTILVVFLVDHVGSGPAIVNWGVLAEKLGAAKEEVRKDVHDATAPKGESPAPAPEPAEAR